MVGVKQYKLERMSEQFLRLPKNSAVLSVTSKDDWMVLNVLVDTTEYYDRERYFIIVKNDTSVNGYTIIRYIGTVEIVNIVPVVGEKERIINFHVFEVEKIYDRDEFTRQQLRANKLRARKTRESAELNGGVLPRE